METGNVLFRNISEPVREYTLVAALGNLFSIFDPSFKVTVAVGAEED